MRKVLLMLTASLALVASAYAQERTVSGKVTSTEDGSSLPGVNVVIKGTTNGTVTDADGSYKLNVPSASSSLVFSFIGLQTKEIAIGDRAVVDVSLALDVTQLSEIVVTGVAVGTSTKKLGFAIGKVGDEQLREVPAVDAGNALRGKISGIQVVQATGRPGTAPSIRLRGVTAISGGQSPLIIIDGTITNGSLADINMSDVERIEVLKGAAASSLYGSLAGNGVIQLITKRGAEREGVTRVTLRNEVGTSQLARKVPLATHHRWQVDTNGDYLLTNPADPNTRIADADFIIDNNYKKVFDNQDLLFQPKPYVTNYISVGSTSSKSKVFASFENLDQGGIVVDQPSFSRQNVRFNADLTPNDKFKLTVSTLFSNSARPDNGENGQGGLFYPILAHEPDQDLEATKNSGVLPRSQSNLQNPLYEVRNLRYVRDRRRLLNNFTTSYKLADWLRVEGQYSLDNEWNFNEDYTKKGYITQNVPQGGPGSMSQFYQTKTASIATASAYFSKKFGDLNLTSTLRYQLERYTDEQLSTSGSNFSVGGIADFELLDQTTLQIDDYENEIIAENVFFNLGADFKDKYIFEGLVRRDGSSLFGEDERYQLFYRATGAYRLTEDVTIPGVQELKLRTSYGTSGARPPFDARYEYYTASNGSVSATLVGNKKLKPSKIAELEVGVNASFLDRFTFEFNYAKIKADDQILAVPLPKISPFPFQYRNAGTVETDAIELSLGATIIENDNFTWSANLVGSRSKSVVTKLDVPELLRGDGISSGMFRIKEGEEFGAIYGNTFAKSLSDFIVDSNGDITNISGYVLGGAANRQLDDFEVNSDGYVVGVGTQGLPTESATILYDPATGQKLDKKIGNSRPDFILGLSQNFAYKNFSLYVLFDSQVGGDVYNSTKQNLYFQERHGDVDQSGKADGEKKTVNYYSNAVSLYNGAAPASHFVEDASYLKLREVAFGYKISNSIFQKIGIGNIIQDGRVSLIGRNLLTFTKYTGFDPEVASLSASDPTSFRSDAYVYPMFRTYAVSLELKF